MTINAIFMSISVLAICATVVLTLFIKTKDNKDRRRQSAENLKNFTSAIGDAVTHVCETQKEIENKKLEALKAEKAPEDSGK